MSAPNSPGGFIIAKEVGSEIQFMKSELFRCVFSINPVGFLISPLKFGFCEMTQAVFSSIVFEMTRSVPSQYV